MKLFILTLAPYDAPLGARRVLDYVSEDIQLDSRERDRRHPKVLEGFTGQRDERLDDGVYLARQVPYLLLGMVIHAELQKMEEVVQIDLPIKLGVRTLREVGPGQLSGDPLCDKFIVYVKSEVTRGFLLCQEIRPPLAELLFATLGPVPLLPELFR
jgi:hypothetical protein